MKKITCFVILGVVASGTAFAGSDMQNNMNNTMAETMTETVMVPNNNSVTVMTVEQVRGLPDNSPVVIQGYLLRQNGEESYIFQDATGTINVEIDDGDWGGLTVTPNDMVEVWGEVDKNGMSMIEIDVSAIKKI